MASDEVSLFLCGDVMVGRGIDQILPYPSEPRLDESYVKDARTYIALAERVNGRIPRPVSFEYVWGEALLELARRRPLVRVANLETSITRRGVPWPQKPVRYRLSPENAACLKLLQLDLCSLANNHVLDFGSAGLDDTFATLDSLHIAHAGAGRSLEQAARPAVCDIGQDGRILFFAACFGSAGVPPTWGVDPSNPGVRLLPDLSRDTVRKMRKVIDEWRAARDLVVLSLHWGPTWGYEITPEERTFAQRLIDEAGVDVVHGHSSHHVKGIEVHQGRLILYGCGDFVNDYEGITGRERYHPELGAMYFARLERETGRLLGLSIVTTHMRRFRLELSDAREERQLSSILSREGAALGTSLEQRTFGELMLRWRG